MNSLPVFFFGHGSPMNAIEQNSFTKSWNIIGKTFKNFKAILFVSAHYETYGTFITSRNDQKIMYDFGGFPKELYDFRYPITGSSQFAEEIKNKFQHLQIGLDENRKIDHGVWSILVHLFPDWVDVPVLQLSIDRNKSFQDHFEFARNISSLRDEGYLILSSGNIVHNLGMLHWQQEKFSYPWAQRFEHKMKKNILEKQTGNLFSYEKNDQDFSLSVPTFEHFIPVIYTYGLLKNDEIIQFFNQEIIYGSLSMTSFGTQVV